MGDLISIAFLVTFAAVIFREHYQQCAEDRADRRSLREYEATPSQIWDGSSPRLLRRGWTHRWRRRADCRRWRHEFIA